MKGNKATKSENMRKKILWRENSTRTRIQKTECND